MYIFSTRASSVPSTRARLCVCVCVFVCVCVCVLSSREIINITNKLRERNVFCVVAKEKETDKTLGSRVILTIFSST